MPRTRLTGLLVGALAASSPAKALPPDPSTLQSHACVRSQALAYADATYGSISGRVYRPVAGACLISNGPPAGVPVVLFLNGAGYGRDDYDYLANHLAHNGHVVVVVVSDEPDPSLACAGSPSQICIEDRARKAVAYLRQFQQQWSWAGQVDFARVSVGGHSRGGEAAVEAARLIYEEEDTLGNPGVRAVFSLAPTDEGDDGLTGRRRLLGRQSSAFLVLYGSRDEQVKGYDPQVPLLFPPAKTGFALYDRAGREGSLEGLPISFDDQVDRSFQYLERANHEQFSDRCGTPIACFPSVIACNTQHLATQGYVNALLLWKVFGQTSYRAFLDATTESIWTPAWPQWSAGPWNSRRVVDNFQDGELGTSTLGGTLSVSGNLTATVVDNAATHPQVPHGAEDGQRLLVEVGAASNSNILQWTIPPNRVDVSGFTHLAVRLGQTSSAVGTARVRFRLQRGGSWSPLVASDGYGTLPDLPSNWTECPDGSWPESVVTPMRTFMIPLSAFGGDLTNVTRVQIRFDDATTANDDLYLDNLEFTGGIGLPEL